MAQQPDLKLFDVAQGPRIIGPEDGKLVDLGSIGARMMAWTEETGWGFSLLEHPMPPRSLAAPNRNTPVRTSTASNRGADGRPARRRRRLCGGGRLGVQAARSMAHVLERRRRALSDFEIISPGGFEHFFDEFGTMMEGPEFNPVQLGELELATGSVPARERAAAVRGARTRSPAAYGQTEEPGPPDTTGWSRVKISASAAIRRQLSKPPGGGKKTAET